MVRWHSRSEGGPPEVQVADVGKEHAHVCGPHLDLRNNQQHRFGLIPKNYGYLLRTRSDSMYPSLRWIGFKA